MIGHSTFLKSLNEDALGAFIEGDHDMNDGLSDGQNTGQEGVVDNLVENYEGICDFIIKTIAKVPGLEGVDEVRQGEVFLATAIVVGAICKAAEVVDAVEVRTRGVMEV